jgi:hypothetical protein
MENRSEGFFDGRFSSPEEELVYLREQMRNREEGIRGHYLENKVTKDEMAKEEIQKYASKRPEEVISENVRMSEPEIEKIFKLLEPEAHDKQMQELLRLLSEKGVMNVLSIVRKMNSPHLEDDLHRVLVQYVKNTDDGLDRKMSAPMLRALKMTLYEISLTDEAGFAKERGLKELISSMEQFYSGMLSIADESNNKGTYFTIEFALPHVGEEVVIYASVPDGKKNMFEKQLHSVFPNAKLTEQRDDYNIFNEEGFSVGSVARLTRKPVFPIKTYEQFDHDPLTVLLNSFSKIKKEGEGASVQFTFRPAGKAYTDKYEKVLKEFMKGTPLDEAYNKISISGVFLNLVRDIATGKKPLEVKPEEEKEKHISEDVVENIKAKISTPIVQANVRIVTSAETRDKALSLLSEVESTFNQFENSSGNKLVFKRLAGKNLDTMFRRFSFRLFADDTCIPLNLHEFTTLAHFPVGEFKSIPNLKHSKSGTAPAPVGTPLNGVLLGVNRHRGEEHSIRITSEDRLRHFYAIGQTGTGKSTMLKNMIIQDILNGDGVCMIDPHGSDIEDVLNHIPKERYEDVIYFDPSDVERPMALNMLEYDYTHPEQKTFIANEMLSIFNKLFDMKTAGGPIFEQYFRNSTLLVMDDPSSGNTLLDLSRVLADKSFRELKLSRCQNPVIIQFWNEVASKAGGDAALQNMVPYITSKFDVFLTNDIMRPIVSQERSSFDFRKVMDEKKIFLVNLAKGRLGDLNSNLLGLIIVGRLLMSALSRVDSLGRHNPPFYLYIDEFQNFTTPSIETILSEARKYGLGLSIAHQFVAQLEERIKNAVFGNVGTIAAFRVGADDAEYLKQQFEPVFSSQDLMNLDNRHAYLRLLVDGRPVKPFNIETLAPPVPTAIDVGEIKRLSREKFGRDRADVEREINDRYRKVK